MVAASVSHLAANVASFLEDSTQRMASILSERWGQEVFCALLEKGMRSPIEHLFYIAAKTLCDGASTPFNPDPELSEDGSLIIGPGMYLDPQVKIGRYTVDFLISVHTRRGRFSDPVVVELDGHDFHDKDKNQRAYEKARDRFLVKEGYKVLHYTGSEVNADPYRVAHEAVRLAGLAYGCGVEDYDPANPTGFE